MKIFYFLFSIAIAITVAEAGTIIRHTIQGKETIPMLAKKYCTTKSDIEKRNNLQANKYVKRGTVLRVAMNTTFIKANKKVIQDIATISKLSTKEVHSLDEIRKNRQLEIAKKQKLNNEIIKRQSKSSYVINQRNSSSVVYTLDKIRKKQQNKTVQKQKTTNKIIEQQSTSSYVIEQTSSSSAHTLDKIRQKLQDKRLKKLLDKKNYATKINPNAVKRIVRRGVVNQKKPTTHTLKSVKKQDRLIATLKKHKKLFKLKKGTPKRVTVNDITFKSSRSSIASNNKDVNKIINIAKTKLGRKYVWGAVGKRGTFDCSGFTSYVYKKNGIHIPRTSRNQAKYGKYVSRNNLKKGDLIFFDTSKHRKGYVNHVGIYLGNGKFIHASSAQKKVVVSRLSKFYAQRYVGARRPS